MAKFTSIRSAHAGYYYDSDTGFMYSTKRKGSPYRMSWNRAYPGATERVALSMGGWKDSLTRADVVRAFSIKMKEVVAPKNKFVAQIQKDQAVPKVALAVPQNSGNGFIIGSRQGGVFSFAVMPVVHPTLAAGRAEAERLANKNPGKKFVLVCIMGSVQSGGINWE